MTRYHCNPETGKTGVCRSDPSNENARGCDFKLSPSEHYGTPEESQAEYESSMKAQLFPVSSTTMRQKQDEWFGQLSELEEEALGFYSRPSSHRAFNRRIREGDTTAEDNVTMQALDSALRKAPRSKNLQTIYRGIATSPEKLRQFLKDGMVTNAGYSSGTFSRKIAKMFAQKRTDNDVSLMLSFETTSQAYLDTGEKEVLLPRGTSLRILSHEFDEESGEYVIHCEEMVTADVPDGDRAKA